MKKFTRNEKLKIYERIKTSVIFLLFIGSLFLGYRVFKIYRSQTSGENLWRGANSTLAVGSTNNTVAKTQLSIMYQISKPELVLVNTPYSRHILPEGSNEFKSVFKSILTLIREAYLSKAENLLIADSSEWENSLRVNSLYLRFHSERYTDFESAYWEAGPSNLSKQINSYSDIVVVPDKADNVILFFKDINSKRIVKIKTNGGSELYNIITQYSSADSSSEFAFAFELNLDEEEKSDKTTLNSMLIIPTQGLEVNDISVGVPKIYKTVPKLAKPTEFTSGLINIFGYNPNTIRQYISSENALIFVGETGTLSVYPNGKIVYKALGTNEGISLVTQGQPITYAITSGLCNIIERVFVLSGINIQDCGFDIKLSKMPELFINNKKALFCYDYFVDGKKVVVGSKSSISGKVENGKLIEFEMNVRDINVLTSHHNPISIFEAIDGFCAEHPDIKRLRNGALVYQAMDNPNSVKTVWEIQGEE